MNLRTILPAGLALAALTVAGCGGGDGDDPTTAAEATVPTVATLSKAELLSQGDAICAEVNAAVGTVAGAEADAAVRTSQEASIYSGMVDRLKALGTPDDETGYPEFLAAAEALAQAEDSAGLAASREDSVALQNAQSDVSAAFSAFQSAAANYGFEECGNAPSAPVTGSGAEPGAEEEAAAPEAVEEEAEAPEAVEEEAEVAPETGGAGSTETGGGTAPGGEEGGGVSGGGSGGVGPG